MPLPFLLPLPLPPPQYSQTPRHKRQAQAPHRLTQTGTQKNGVATKWHRRLLSTLRACQLSSPSAELAHILSTSLRCAESLHRRDCLPCALSCWHLWSSDRILADRRPLSTRSPHLNWYGNPTERSTSSIASSIPLLRWSRSSGNFQSPRAVVRMLLDVECFLSACSSRRPSAALAPATLLSKLPCTT